MPLLTTIAAAVSVAAIFVIWRGYAEFMCRRQRTLRERVAYMLWMAAEDNDSRGPRI
jgi:hypothetical protein